MRYRVESSCNFPSRRMSPVGEPPFSSINQMASENPVVIFSMSTCCMCLAVERFFNSMAVNPTVYELDKTPAGEEMEKELMSLQLGGASLVPVVFVGGKLVGSVDRVLAAHITGSLVPLLKEAGALWL